MEQTDRGKTELHRKARLMSNRKSPRRPATRLSFTSGPHPSRVSCPRRNNDSAGQSTRSRKIHPWATSPRKQIRKSPRRSRPRPAAWRKRSSKPWLPSKARPRRSNPALPHCLLAIAIPGRQFLHPPLPAQSLSENWERCCFRGQGRMARRDEGEYPSWVFDRGATKPGGLGRENPPGGGAFGFGLRCHGRHSPLRGCSARSASPKPKIPCRSTSPNFQTGSQSNRGSTVARQTRFPPGRISTSSPQLW